MNNVRDCYERALREFGSADDGKKVGIKGSKCQGEMDSPQL